MHSKKGTKNIGDLNSRPDGRSRRIRNGTVMNLAGQVPGGNITSLLSKPKKDLSPAAGVSSWIMDDAKERYEAKTGQKYIAPTRDCPRARIFHECLKEAKDFAVAHPMVI